MKERRWPWLLSGALFVAAGLVSGYAAYLSSLPCADAVLTQGPVAPLLILTLRSRAVRERRVSAPEAVAA